MEPQVPGREWLCQWAIISLLTKTERGMMKTQKL